MTSATSTIIADSALRVADHHRRIDQERAAVAVAELLDALGLDPADDGLRETPRRVAHALSELLTPQPFRPTTFPNDAGYDELVLVRGIPFVPLCRWTPWSDPSSDPTRTLLPCPPRYLAPLCTLHYYVHCGSIHAWSR